MKEFKYQSLSLCCVILCVLFIFSRVEFHFVSCNSFLWQNKTESWSKWWKIRKCNCCCNCHEMWYGYWYFLVQFFIRILNIFRMYECVCECICTSKGWNFTRVFIYFCFTVKISFIIVCDKLITNVLKLFNFINCSWIKQRGHEKRRTNGHYLIEIYSLGNKVIKTVFVAKTNIAN